MYCRVKQDPLSGLLAGGGGDLISNGGLVFLGRGQKPQDLLL